MSDYPAHRLRLGRAQRTEEQLHRPASAQAARGSPHESEVGQPERHASFSYSALPTIRDAKDAFPTA